MSTRKSFLSATCPFSDKFSPHSTARSSPPVHHTSSLQDCYHSRVLPVLQWYHSAASFNYGVTHEELMEIFTLSVKTISRPLHNGIMKMTEKALVLRYVALDKWEVEIQCPIINPFLTSKRNSLLWHSRYHKSLKIRG